MKLKKDLFGSTLCLILTGVLSFLCLIGTINHWMVCDCSAQTMESYSEEEAVFLLREGLQNRLDRIEVLAETTAGLTSEEMDRFTQSLFEKAVEHTGNSTEGDALYWEIAQLGRGAGYVGRSETGAYRYRLLYAPVYYSDAAQEAQTRERVREIGASLRLEGLNPYEKLCRIYGWICRNVRYEENGSLGYSAYGAAVSGKCLCQGYALLLYRLSLEAGIDCRVIAGKNHAWNLVELGGRYYHADGVWDAGKVFGDYTAFLRSEAGIRLTDTALMEHLREAPFDQKAFEQAYPVSGSDYPLTEPEREKTLPVPALTAACVRTDAVKLTWAASSADGYEIQRQDSLEDWNTTAMIRGGEACEWTDPSGRMGETYVYRIRAFKGEQFSDWSNSCRVLQEFCGPMEFKEILGGNKNKVILRWEKRAKAQGYEIERKRPGGSWKKLTSLENADRTAYTDRTVTEGKRYYYRIRAFCRTDDGKIIRSGSKAGTVLTGLLKPVLSTTVLDGNPVITWSTQKGISGYRIYRKKAGEKWKKVADCSPKVSAYTDSKAPEGENCFYTVRAYKKADPAEEMAETLWSPYDHTGIQIRSGA